MKIYLICPVRKCGKREKKLLYEYVHQRETAGDEVFYADRDVNQNDDTGLGIITAERKAILWADAIHVWWKADKKGKSKSEGSVFDFGMAWMAMAFMSEKRIVIANPEMVKAPPHKSYTTVLKVLDELPKNTQHMRRVILESPFAGDIEKNINYARACLHDCLLKNEAPIASHLLYTQPGVLDDKIPEERALGISAGLVWGALAEATVVYTDYGISKGMEYGIKKAESEGRPVEYRTIFLKHKISVPA